MNAFIRHEPPNSASPKLHMMRLSTRDDSAAANGITNSCGRPTQAITSPICIGV
jgi:hypothetical protein